MSSSPPKTGLTKEQRDALDPGGRVRLIHAGPGSGKTRVFVTALEDRLQSWSWRTAGVAALSFTNVAAEEISRRLESFPSHPHFVGTLDSFVWRFVVRPFAHLAGVTPDGPRLIAGPLEDVIAGPEVQLGPKRHERTSIFRLTLQVSETGLSVLQREQYTGRLVKVEDLYVQDVRKAKNADWAKTGRLTHSDTHAIAWKLLRGQHADEIVDRIVRRFPVILVDEFQDTNHFLGRALLKVLGDQRVEALLVGDRDQAIFRFGGADKGLFADASRLDGASSHPLRTTHRFGKNIAAVAEQLARSEDPINVIADVAPGRVLLFTHSSSGPLDGASIEQLGAMLRDEGCVTTALVARRNSWLAGKKTPLCPLKAKAARQLHDAAARLRAGNSRVAVSIVESYLQKIVIDGDAATPERLQQAGIGPLEWKRTVRRVLFSAASCPPDETWDAWRLRQKSVLQTEVRRLRTDGSAGNVGRTLKAGVKGKGAADAVRMLSQPEAKRGLEELTVHGAKGREFDGVVVYWPKPGGRGKVGCPCDEWWSDDASSDEREIAYVAATRAKKLLVLCLHEDTAAALRDRRGDFFAKLEWVNAAPTG